MKKQTLLALGKYGIGFGALFWVIWKNWNPPPGSPGPGLSQALQGPKDLGAAAAAALIFLGAVLLTFYRWYILVLAQDLPLTLFQALRLGTIGFYSSTVLPSAIGGDIVKAIFVARGQKGRTVAVATVLIDRVLGLWGLIWVIVLLGLAFWLTGNQIVIENARLRTIVLMSCAIIAATLVAWFLVQLLPLAWSDLLTARLERVPTVGHSLAELWRAVWMYRLKQGSLVAALGVSILGHIGFVLAFYFSAHVFFDPNVPNSVPSLSQHFLLVPIGLAFESLFPSPGGLGGGEYVFGILYTLVGKPEAAGVLACLAKRMITWGWSLVGLFFVLCTKPGSPPLLVSEAGLPTE